MWTYQINLHSFCLLLFFKTVIPDTHDQNRFCRGDKPAVKICTDDTLNVQQIVYIDTINVPTYQENNCGCTIDLPYSDEIYRLSYTYTEPIPKDMKFRINNVLLEDSAENDEDSQEDWNITLVNPKATLSVHTPANYINSGACPEVSIEKTTFRITCKKVEIFRKKFNSLTSPRQPETSTGRNNDSNTYETETSTLMEVKTGSVTELEKETNNGMIKIFSDTHVQNRFCKGDKPVVQICTDDMSDVSKTVHIDTNKVPTYQENNCECTIDFPYLYDIRKLSYTYTEPAPKDMEFIIDKMLLKDSADNSDDSQEDETIDLVNQKAILSLHTPVHHTNGGTCLEISIKNSNFTITCTKVKIFSTKSSTLTSPRQPETSTGRKSDSNTHETETSIFMTHESETSTSKEINTVSDTELEKETDNEMITRFPDTNDQKPDTNRFCKGDKPVVQICTDDMRVVTTTIHIDTNKVPTYQENNCECDIDLPPSDFIYKLSYAYVGPVSKDMEFRIDNVLLNDSAKNKEIDIINTRKTTLSLHTPANHTDGGACLEISIDKTVFRITCKKAEIFRTKSSTLTSRSQTETSTERKSDSYTHESETSTSKEINTASDTELKKETENEMIIMPVVAAISGLFCLVIVVLLFIFCRRRSAKRTDQARNQPRVAEAKVEDNDYYMTENPMYVKSDANQKEEKLEDNYHYIEHDENINHYESAPDSSLEKPSANVTSQEQHYDYSTCLPQSQRGRLAPGNIGANTTSGKDTGIQNSKPITDENMYDKTGTSWKKQFQGTDEYHHISLAGLRKKPVVEESTYNTLGNTSNMHNNDAEGEENSDYHVTNFRR